MLATDGHALDHMLRQGAPPYDDAAKMESTKKSGV
jgi:hypothetical protein